jgi:signal peptidase
MTRRLISAAATAAAVVLVGLWFVTLRPVALGGTTVYLIVVGSSMQPTLHEGDLVLAFPASDYEVGDVVVYPVPEGEPGAGKLVIHRIVGGDAVTGFIVEGDNSAHPDPFLPAADDLAGRASIQVGRVGWVLFWLRQPLTLASAAAAAAIGWWLSRTDRRGQAPARRARGADRV